MNEELANGSYGWDAEISDEGQEFEPLPEGEYEFKVLDFQRKYHNASDRIPACYFAALVLEVKSADGRTSRAFENLYLNKKFEWKTTAFFRSIGMKKPGEPVKPDWDAVLGASGRALFEIHEYNGRKNNQVKKYIDAKVPMKTANSKTAATAFQVNDEDDGLPF